MMALFKAEDAREEEDPYSAALSSSSPGLTPVVVPVVQFEFCNLEELSGRLRDDLRRFSAVAFTSPRACEAAQRAMGKDGGEIRDIWRREERGGKRVFAVGGKTAAAAARVMGRAKEDVEGEECGTAEALAEVAAKVLGVGGGRVLFPCGELASEAFAARLVDLGHEVTRVECYRTREHHLLAEKVDKLAAAEETEGARLELAAFFSPSGVRFALPHLERNGFFGSESESARLKACAIGPTTRRALEEAGVGCFAVAEKPNAEMLARAIKEASTRHDKLKT